MRNALLILGCAALAGCATTSSPPGAPPAQPGACQADRAASGVGQPYSATLAERLRQAAGARTVRPLRPDTVVTLEYSAQRLNLDLDAADVIRKVRCG